MVIEKAFDFGLASAVPAPDAHSDKHESRDFSAFDFRVTVGQAISSLDAEGGGDRGGAAVDVAGGE